MKDTTIVKMVFSAIIVIINMIFMGNGAAVEWHINQMLAIIQLTLIFGFIGLLWSK